MMYQTFIDRYRQVKNQPTPGEQFIDQIAAVTHRSKSTVQKWVTGAQNPDKASKHEIASFLGAPVEELFPETIVKGHDKQ